jgi:hypothetical protein
VAMLLSEYIDWYNQERIKENLQGLSPVQYRTQSLQVAYEQHYLALQTYWVQFISGPFDLRPLHGDILVLCVGLARIARCGSFRACVCSALHGGSCRCRFLGRAPGVRATISIYSRPIFTDGPLPTDGQGVSSGSKPLSLFYSLTEWNHERWSYRKGPVVMLGDQYACAAH